MVMKKNMKKKVNPWIVHLKKFALANPKMKYRDAMKAAKKTYVKLK